MLYLQEAKEAKVIDCRFFYSLMGTGITILTGRYHFYTINNLDEKRVRKLANPPGKLLLNTFNDCHFVL